MAKGPQFALNAC